METNSILNNKKEENVMDKSILNVKQLMKEFKEVCHNGLLNPYIDIYSGAKVYDRLVFEHYIVYALIKGKDVAKVTHDIKSDRFMQAIANLNGSSDLSFYKDRAYQRINHVFKSLSKEEYAELLLKLKVYQN